VFLDGTRVKELDVEKLRGSLTQEAIVNPAFADYHNAPMKGLSSGGDALEAFQNYLKDNSYKEVSL
ncbi:MAG: hypothetical protein GX256_10675, partial [Fretibacterium sp.]|nr:hypothetical protein [Fretibacterium sp.]